MIFLSNITFTSELCQILQVATLTHPMKFILNREEGMREKVGWDQGE